MIRHPSSSEVGIYYRQLSRSEVGSYGITTVTNFLCQTYHRYGMATERDICMPSRKVWMPKKHQQWPFFGPCTNGYESSAVTNKSCAQWWGREEDEIRIGVQWGGKIRYAGTVFAMTQLCVLSYAASSNVVRV